MSKQQVSAPFASIIRERRNAIGMTQDDLAKEIGCPQQTIEKIETGKTRKSGYLPAIFSVLGLDLKLLTAARPLPPDPPEPKKFIRSSAIKFYVRQWREFMGVGIREAAKASGLGEDEYQASEVYPINFTLGQVAALADEFGIRGDQFWFPPPAKSPLVAAAQEKQRMARGRK